ncbi:MAG: twin-arginine translocation signal domain-containing protein, partial [Bacteroidales bacterium]|nr:twin-arginine translocation signal domain-containing protein [Bacteroidales bacterium]
MKENNLTRRSFLKTSAVAGAVGVIGTGSAG